MNFTLVVPFYRNISMLKRQVEEWNRYPIGVRIILVDDGSPEPAKPIVLENERERRAEVYRIGVDIPWNRGGARNLGAHMALTDWIVQVDIDHLLPAESAAALLEFTPDPNRWYRFRRWRVGKADETRKKDKIHDDCEYGEIHEHVDSYLVRRDIYWKAGGYDEDFSGCLGGGNMFLWHLARTQPGAMLPEMPRPIGLHVYTRDKIKDASDDTLSRDKCEYSRRRRDWIKRGSPKAKNPLRFPWSKEL